MRGGRRCCPGHLLLPWPPPASPAPPRRRHGAPRSPWLSLTLSLASSSPLLSLPLCPSGARRHRRRSPRPQPPPRSLLASLSSVPTPWSCTPTHATRGGPSRPEHRRLHPRCPEIAVVNSPLQRLPRAHRASLPTPCELLRLSPLSLKSNSPSSTSAAAPESLLPPSMAPPWPQLLPLASEHCRVLSTLLGAGRAHLFDLPFPLAPTRTNPELRPPPRARFR